MSRRARPAREGPAGQAWRAGAWARMLVAVLTVGLAVILLRVAQLKVIPDSRLAAAMGSRTSSFAELARRGDLLDARGRVLATSTVGYRLFVDPAEVSDLPTVAVDIAGVIGGAVDEIDRQIVQARSRRFVVVRELLEDWQVDAIRRAGLRGVGVQSRTVRQYPHGDVAASVVGLVGAQASGLSGSEHVFERDLAPRDGKLSYLRDAQRRTLGVDPEGYQPPAPGRDVRLSIDLAVQEVALRHLREAVARYDAGGGRCVVLDVRTGGLLAMADVLNSRPARAATRDPGRAIDPALGRNRCVSDPYEPGSTLKPFIWAAITEMGRARPEELLPTPSEGPWRTRYGRLVRDAHPAGPVSWRNVLVKSLNAGMAMVSERLSHRDLRAAVLRFGFGSKTGCRVPGETAGLLTDPRAWSDYTQTSVAMGHEIAVTPVQMVRAFSAFCRDGTVPPLSILAPGEGGRTAPAQRVCSEAMADMVREVLRDVVHEGTGRPARSQRYSLFAKSGTAQLPKPGGGGYYEDRYVSSFIAGAPYDDPAIVVLVVIDDPDRRLGHWGGSIAGPPVKEILEETLAYLGVPPDVLPQADTVASVD